MIFRKTKSKADVDQEVTKAKIEVGGDRSAMDFVSFCFSFS